MTKRTPHENHITLDELAGMMQQEFMDIRDKITGMVTKDDLTEMKSELKEEIKGLHNTQMTHFETVFDNQRRLNTLEPRVTTLENRLGTPA